jgi:membrane protein implicated in regulation of membrane protease activity
MALKESTMGKLGLWVFGLLLLSFLIRGPSQFLVGQKTAKLLAGPPSILALCILVFLIGYWVLAKVGVTTIERDLD